MTNNQLTKEWLQQTIAELESVRDEIPFGIDTNSELELAAFKMALAAMDSEPVAWTEKCEITNMQATGLYLRGFPDNSHGRDIPLYRHAQPAPVVMDEVTAEYCPALVKYDVTEVDEAWARGFNACSAAMLQAEPVTAANKLGNSPVIPDTWIPISERMPENKPGSYEYLVFEKLNNRVNHDYWNVPDAGDDTFTPFWNHYGEYVTHWMPLPAAPQEVKGE